MRYSQKVWRWGTTIETHVLTNSISSPPMFWPALAALQIIMPCEKNFKHHIHANLKDITIDFTSSLPLSFSEFFCSCFCRLDEHVKKASISKQNFKYLLLFFHKYLLLFFHFTSTFFFCTQAKIKNTLSAMDTQSWNDTGHIHDYTFLVPPPFCFSTAFFRLFFE